MAKKKIKADKKVKNAQSEGTGWVAAIKSKLNWRIVTIIVAGVLCITALILGLALGLRDCGKKDDININTVSALADSHKNVTQVGYSAEVIGKAERTKPVKEVQDGGLETGYPKYGSTKNLTTEQKQDVIDENIQLTANGTWRDVSKRTTGSYDKMDKDGYLYLADGTPVLDSNGNHRQLYKHTGSVGLYMGDVDDKEQAVVKKCTFRKRTYSSYYNVTGLYAPAGEVIKIEISEKDMNATGGIVVHIGQALYNGQANNIWPAKGFNRMPIILNTMSVTPATAELKDGVYTAYVGSFLGGPIYVRDETATFSVTISGGVNYAHFILGVTTEEEYNTYLKSSAPYFDLEVWESGVLHSGPKRYAQSFSYNDLYKAAVLWEKISLVSSKVRNQGVVFLYDAFVAAGAAVAFPGRRSVNCPAGWMSGSLNYNGLVTSGSWGNLHEYHHNFQGYGVGDRGEVTNNALTLVSYSLFTKISASRQIASYGCAGLSGWNRYTSAGWALNQVNNGAIGSTNGLSVYATLMHNLGQDAFIKSAVTSGTNYWNKWQENTHQDMSYYANLVAAFGGTHNLAQNDYPMFVPVSSVYQTGRSYMYDNEKREITTMQPYVINYGQPFTVDLNPYAANSAGQYESGSVFIGKGFSYKIKGVDTSGINGTFVKTDKDGIYTFTPNEELNSGKIKVTLEIYYGNVENGVREYNGKKLDDVELTLEFQQSHESKKAILERTTYKYEAGQVPESATAAFESNYAGYTEKVEEDNINLTQNSNTDRWYSGVNGINGKLDLPPENSVLEINGKLFCKDDGKYRVYLRGRYDCALYFSLDGKDYKLGATIKDINSTANFRVADSNTYFDVEFLEGNCTVTAYTGGEKTYNFEIQGDNWLYIKEVLIIQTTGKASYIGVGINQWTQTMFTSNTKYCNEKGEEVASFEAEGYAYTETTYQDYDGKAVAAMRNYKDGSTKYYKIENNTFMASTADEVSEITASRLIAPTSAAYATAYRSAYEFQKQFESDYFYKKEYNYNYSYSDRVDYTLNKTIVSISHEGAAAYPTANLVDGNTTTSFHSAGTGSGNKAISEKNPFELVVDQGEVIKANHVTFYCFSHSTSNNKKNNIGFVKTFTLYGSLNGEDWFEITSQTDYVNPDSPSNVTFDFETKEFRYYKLYVTKTDNGAHFAMNEIVFYLHNPENDLTLTGNGKNHISPDNEMFTYKGDWSIAQAASTFGHVYLGSKGATMEFKFEGTRLAVLTSKKFEANFEVYIDGKKVDSITVKESDNDFAITYLSPELSEGEHKVEIKCVGECNIDSIASYN